MAPGSAPAQPSSAPSADDWEPYEDRVAFELAEFLYSKEQMSAGNIDRLLEMWAASQLKHNDSPPFRNHKDLYSTIDSTPAPLGIQVYFEI